MKPIKAYFNVLLLLLLAKGLFGQLITTNAPSSTNGNPQWLIENILIGSGVTASNITFQGNLATQIGFFNGTASNIGLSKGIILTSGDIAIAPGSPGNFQNGASASSSQASPDADLSALVNSPIINDAAILEFDFIPIGDSIVFGYVFASEEYPEWVCSSFNDVFGFFISGPGINGPFQNNAKNIALVPGTNTPVAINSVNPGNAGLGGDAANCDNLDPNWPSYSSYYINNNGNTSSHAVEYDGFTTVLNAAIGGLQCGQTYHIKLAIADVFDFSFDSGVFLEQGSFTSPGVDLQVATVTNNNEMIEACAQAELIFIRPDTSGQHSIQIEIGGTAQNGVDYSFLASTIVFAPGQDSVVVLINPLADVLNEGTETLHIKVLNISDCGDTLYEEETVLIKDGYVLPVTAQNGVVNCAGDAATVSVLASGGLAPYTYVWSGGGVGLSNTYFPMVSGYYTVTASDFPGCKGVDTFFIDVLHPSPLVDAGLDTLICIGSQIQLAASGAFLYTWSPSNFVDNAFSSSPNTNLHNSAMLYVSGIDFFGCVGKDSIMIGIDSVQNITIGNDTAVCFGSSVFIGTNAMMGAYTFNWTPSNGLNNSQLQNPLASPLTNTQYILTYTNGNGCMGTDSVSIGVLPLPILSVSNDTVICMGDTAMLSVFGALTYNWLQSSLVNNSTASQVQAWPVNSTLFEVVGMGNVCADTAKIMVLVNDKSHMTAGYNPWACPGDTTLILASGATTYVWTPDTFLLGNNTANPMVYPPVSGIYTVQMVDSMHCTKTDSVLVLISDTIPVDAGMDFSLCQGDSAFLGAFPSAPPNVVVAWSPNIEITDTSLFNPLISINSSRMYYLEASSSSCYGKDSVFVNFNATPTVSIAGNDSICKGQFSLLTASGASVYAWNSNDSISINTGNVTTFMGQNSAWVSLTGTDVNTCKNTDTLQITVMSLPLIQITGDSVLCYADTGQLYVSGGINYHWFPSAFLNNQLSDSIFIFPNGSVYYKVIVEGQNGCYQKDSVLVQVFDSVSIALNGSFQMCMGDTLLWQVSGASHYTWTPSNFIIGDTTSDAVWLNPNGNSMVALWYTDSNNCSGSKGFDIQVFSLPVLVYSVGDTLSLCRWSDSLVVVSGANQYQWLTTGNGSMTNGMTITGQNSQWMYTIGTDTNTCTMLDSIYVLVYDLPEIISDSVRYVCLHDSVPLVATLLGEDHGTWLWWPSNNLNDSSLSNPVFYNSTQSISLNVQHTDTNGCKDINVLNLEVFEIALSAQNSICLSDSAPLSLQVLGTEGPLWYRWQPADVFDDSTSILPKITNPGTYNIRVWVQDINGCEATDSLELTFTPGPEITLKVDTLLQCNKLVYIIENQQNESAIWITNGDTLSNNTLEVYANYGLEEVVYLQVFNGYGCLADSTLVLKSPSLEQYLDFPLSNVFSPNMDGVNEWFELPLKSSFRACASMEIYNRWGQMVFSGQDYYLSWDGRSFDGQLVERGVYYYVLEIAGRPYVGNLQVVY